MCDQRVVWRVQHFFLFDCLVYLDLSNKSKGILFPGTGFRFLFCLRVLQALSFALLSNSSTYLEEVGHWYVQSMFSWV